METVWWDGEFMFFSFLYVFGTVLHMLLLDPHSAVPVREDASKFILQIKNSPEKECGSQSL